MAFSIHSGYFLLPMAHVHTVAIVANPTFIAAILVKDGGPDLIETFCSSFFHSTWNNHASKVFENLLKPSSCLSIFQFFLKIFCIMETLLLFLVQNLTCVLSVLSSYVAAFSTSGKS